MKNNADMPHEDATELTEASVQANLQLLLDAPDATDKARCIDESQIRECCLTALAMQAEINIAGVTEIELSVQFLNSTAMQSLNEQYRGKNSPTNVLSFESQMPPMMLSEDPVQDPVQDPADRALQVLGDLVFCPEVVHREALEQNKNPEHHWKHLFVHGTLHLCGYDHEEPAQADAMESLEIQILSALGIPDPY